MALRSTKDWLPGTEPQMALDGSWYQIVGPCSDCGHLILWHRLTPWRCQNTDCNCPPIRKRRARRTPIAQ